MSIATALQAKIDEKEAIRLSIEAKGVTVGTEILLSGYPAKVDEIVTGGGDGYQRPADWLEIDSLVVDLDEKFVGLYAIYEDSNFIAFSFGQAYTVDWGDGVVENFVSYTTAYHQYNYNDFVGTNSTRGYRQAIVTVTPQGGNHIEYFDMQKKHTQANLQDYSYNWLDVKLSFSNLLNMKVSSSGGNLGLLEQFVLVGSNSVTSGFTSLFDDCKNLQSVQIDSIDSNYIYRLFYRCTSLKYVQISIPSSAPSIPEMFNACSTLTTIPLLDISLATNVSNMFKDCYNLQTIPLLDLSSSIDNSNMFLNCNSLSKGAMSGTKVTISYLNCKLSQSALVDIFNNLAIVVGQTITITGNWGAAGLTVPERAIATDKGWTIVG